MRLSNKGFIISAILAIFSSVSLFADSSDKLEPDRTVLYAQKDGQCLYMDIYEPAEGQIVFNGQEKPTLIHIFGGGFKDGSRHQEWLRPWFRQMNSLGYRMVSIDYRLGLKDVKDVGIVKFTFLLKKAINMTVEDLFSATLYILNHEDELGIDPYNIVLTGSSAGAITAQQAEWEICDKSRLASVLPQGFNYRGVMAFAGAVLIRGDLRYAAHPCPMVMFHGTEDELVPYDKIASAGVSFCGACTIKTAAEKAGGVVRFYRFPGINHAVAGYMPYMVDKEVDFLQNCVLGGSCESVDEQIVDASLPTYKTDNSNSLYDINEDDSLWKILPSEQGIVLDASSASLPIEDHLEMSGEQVSCVLRWGIDKDRAFHNEKSLVFPLLRTIPNNTHASLNYRISTDIPSLLTINGHSLIKEKTETVRINALVEVTSLWSKSNDFIGVGDGQTETSCIRMTRTIFPSTTSAAVCEKFVIKNVTSDNLLLCVPKFCEELSTDPYAGVDGAYIIRSEIDKSWTGWLAPCEEHSFSVVYQAYREVGEEKPAVLDGEAELASRKALVKELDSSLILESPDPVFNELFRFSKIRACESIYRTKGGLMHSPGGESYYAAIWANDQAEYVNPFFSFVGYANANESALNSFRLFARYMNDEYKPLPSSIIAEGDDIWNGCGDRGDAAMIAYGAARYALACGDISQARELWPLIRWCLEYCRRNLNSQGVVLSDTDELENRFESGDANLCTSTLYYDALISASYLCGELGIEASQYRSQAKELEKSIEKYFGADIAGYHTYRYYDGNTLLRSWICMPLIAGIKTRSEGTTAALLGQELMSENGCLTEQGSDVFWDRSTLYAFRGILYSGNSSDVLPLLSYYSSRRLLGEHVPYAVEAWPEGSQRHLSAESGLYCRVFTEGLFGIRPTGLHSFTMNATLPDGWNSCSLKHCKAFGSDFDITLYRTAKGAVRVKIYDHHSGSIRTFKPDRSGVVKVKISSK